MTRTADRLPPRTRIVDRLTGKRGVVTGYGTTLSPIHICTGGGVFKDAPHECSCDIGHDHPASAHRAAMYGN